LVDILYVLKTGIPWRSARSHIHWNTLYHHFKDKRKNEKNTYSPHF